LEEVARLKEEIRKECLSGGATDRFHRILLAALVLGAFCYGIAIRVFK